MATYTVGQRVWISSVNRRRSDPSEARVTKVGRKLVYVRGANGYRDEAYRIETGVRNDGYGHERIWTDDELAARTRFAEVAGRLKALGVSFTLGAPKYSVGALERVADVLEADST